MKKLLFVMCALILGLNLVNAQTFSVTNSDGKVINYKVTDSVNYEVEVTYTGQPSSGVINIPGSVTNASGSTYSVTSIGQFAFIGSQELTSVTIPEGVTKIGGSAFKNCGTLSSVTLPSTLTAIEFSVFENCKAIRSITVPNSVSRVGICVFKGCTALSSITLPSSLDKLGLHLFRNCINLSSITLPSTINSIDEGAFDSCIALTSIEIPSEVSIIGKEAFKNCSGLTRMDVNANFPPTVKDNAFQGVNSLIPVYVSCDALDLYLAVSHWSYFTNIQCEGNMFSIRVSSNNDEWGRAEGSGSYNENTVALLRATPAEGYRFANWNDGNTDHLRHVHVTQDSSFIAIFEPKPTAEEFTIVVLSNNEEWGTVTGGGKYEEGSIATLTATPNEGYHFVTWNDGNQASSRTITVNENATYTATFEANDSEGIEDVYVMSGVKVYPNPTSGLIQISGVEVERVEVMNVAGEKVAEFVGEEKFDISELNSGVYVLRIMTSEGEAIRRVVKK